MSANSRPVSLTGMEARAAALASLFETPPDSFVTEVFHVVGLPYDRYVQVESPVGELYVAFNDLGISHVATTEAVGGDRATFEALFRAAHGREARPDGETPSALVTAVRCGRGDELRYDLRGLTEFERAVLATTEEIPRGEVRSYSWVAHGIGCPRGARAVGMALSRNPVPILIPCHRVIRQDGLVGRYVFGTSMKRALLEHEGVGVVDERRGPVVTDRSLHATACVSPCTG